MDQLDGNSFLEVFVPRPEDDAHPTAADHPLDDVAADAIACDERRVPRRHRQSDRRHRLQARDANGGVGALLRGAA